MLNLLILISLLTATVVVTGQVHRLDRERVRIRVKFDDEEYLTKR